MRLEDIFVLLICHNLPQRKRLNLQPFEFLALPLQLSHLLIRSFFFLQLPTEEFHKLVVRYREQMRGRGAHIVSNQRDLSDDVIKKLTMSGRCTPSSDPAAQSRVSCLLLRLLLDRRLFFFASENFCRFERK